MFPQSCPWRVLMYFHRRARPPSLLNLSATTNVFKFFSWRDWRLIQSVFSKLKTWSTVNRVRNQERSITAHVSVMSSWDSSVKFWRTDAYVMTRVWRYLQLSRELDGRQSQLSFFDVNSSSGTRHILPDLRKAPRRLHIHLLDSFLYRKPMELHIKLAKAYGTLLHLFQRQFQHFPSGPIILIVRDFDWSPLLSTHTWYLVKNPRSFPKVILPPRPLRAYWAAESRRLRIRKHKKKLTLCLFRGVNLQRENSTQRQTPDPHHTHFAAESRRPRIRKHSKCTSSSWTLVIFVLWQISSFRCLRKMSINTVFTQILTSLEFGF